MARYLYTGKGKGEMTMSTVIYKARKRVAKATLRSLPPRDKQVLQIVRGRTHGATRQALLHTLHTRRTGIVDGALRRLRMAGVVRVKIARDQATMSA